MGLYQQRHRTAAVELDVRSALKSRRIGNGQRGIICRHRLLSRKAVFIRLAVEDYSKTADFVELLLNVQIAGDDAVAEILRIVGVGELMVSVRLGIQPAFDVPQDGCKGGCVLPCEEHRVGHFDVGKAAVRIDDVAAPAGNRDELRIVFRCGEHILLLDMQTELSGTATVVGKIGHANTTPFRWANWFAVSMTSLVSWRMSSLL